LRTGQLPGWLQKLFQTGFHAMRWASLWARPGHVGLAILRNAARVTRTPGYDVAVDIRTYFRSYAALDGPKPPKTHPTADASRCWGGGRCLLGARPQARSARWHDEIGRGPKSVFAYTTSSRRLQVDDREGLSSAETLAGQPLYFGPRHAEDETAGGGCPPTHSISGGVILAGSTVKLG